MKTVDREKKKKQSSGSKFMTTAILVRRGQKISFDKQEDLFLLFYFDKTDL